MRYRLYRRERGMFYLFDNLTGKRQSLQTKDVAVATRVRNVRNEACHHASVNLQIARAILLESDPQVSKRTWQHVMDEMGLCKKGPTKERWDRAMREKPFDKIRNLSIIETRGEQFIRVLSTGTVSTNIFLRRLHNFALDMNWLPAPIVPRKQWPKIEFEDKRAITLEEHEKVLADERNPEWRAYYQLLWHLGGSQTDVASLCAEDIDWTAQTLSYRRRKTGTSALLHFGDAVTAILKTLPAEGPLFPMLITWPETDRAKAFIRRSRRVGIKGISLHSYRYAWAERARASGYPERFAQEALGHGSKAVHRAYARNAKVRIPPLEAYEKTPQRLIPFPQPMSQAK